MKVKLECTIPVTRRKNKFRCSSVKPEGKKIGNSAIQLLKADLKLQNPIKEMKIELHVIKILSMYILTEQKKKSNVGTCKQFASEYDNRVY
jgi:hypothetical protein